MPLLAFALGLALAQDAREAPASGAAAGPRLEVLAGRVQVQAGEGWLPLGPDGRLPEARAEETLHLDWNARARLVAAGADVELRGPLDVKSSFGAPWKLELSGTGEARIDARWTPIELELASAARLGVHRGSYWVESAPGGGWRAGCDAGEPLALRAPAGSRWTAGHAVEAGRQVRIVATSVAPPEIARGGRAAAAPWQQFSWPWFDPAAQP